MMNCIAVGCGGFLGAVCRYLMGKLSFGVQSGFPIATLLINIIGAFVIGFIAAAATKHSGINPQLVLFLKVGLCGGFTTFSTFSLESLTLLQNGKTGAAMCYIILSVVVCILAVFAGQAAAGAMIKN